MVNWVEMLPAKRALCLAVAGLTLGSACPERIENPATRPPPPRPTSSPEWEYPLDPYLGFGRSDSAALRDDTIANWEAFQEDVAIAGCMARKGFRYWPDPWGFEGFGDLDHVAADLGVEAAPGADDGDSRNTRYARRLPRDERDGYYRALYGESLADFEAAGGHGEVPPGRDPETFLQGGCSGRAEDAASPTIWDRSRKLDREFDRLRNRMRKEGATEEEVIEAFIAQSRIRLEALGAAYPGVETYEDALDLLQADARFMRWLTTGRV